MIDGLLGQLVLAADAVHDLEVLLAGGDVADEVELVVRVACESQRVETAQYEGAIADPGVAVVPVALAADRLGRRCRGRREKRARRAVGEPLQGQRAALQKALPWMLGKLAAVDPLAPEIRGALDTLKSLLGSRRRRVLGPVLLAGRVARPGPHQSRVRTLTLAQRLGRVRAGPLETHAKVGDAADRDLVLAAARDGFVVARPGVVPLGLRLVRVVDMTPVEA